MQGFNHVFSLLLVWSILLAVGQLNLSIAAEPTPKSDKPKLYDTTADGKEQIAAALKTATAENKRVILKFGAEW